jgi:hypothetical protein
VPHSFRLLSSATSRNPLHEKEYVNATLRRSARQALSGAAPSVPPGRRSQCRHDAELLLIPALWIGVGHPIDWAKPGAAGNPRPAISAFPGRWVVHPKFPPQVPVPDRIHRPALQEELPQAFEPSLGEEGPVATEPEVRFR